MINPNNIIKYNRSVAELEELILFLVCVAGKKATTVAPQMEKFLSGKPKVNTPFEFIKSQGNNVVNLGLRQQGFGCYTRLTRAFIELANSNLNLRTCTKEDSIKIHGIGLKSASCFLCWTRPNQRLAMLDTHLLKEMKELGLADRIPKSTPSSKKEYERLENVWLSHCDALGVDSTTYDLEVWVRRSNG